MLSIRRLREIHSRNGLMEFMSEHDFPSMRRVEFRSWLHQRSDALRSVSEFVEAKKTTKHDVLPAALRKESALNAQACFRELALV